MAFKVIEIKKSVLDCNDRDAEALRQELKAKGVFLLNLMSSPGSGKTTTLMGTIPALVQRGWRVGVMEADIDSDVDAHTISATGARVIQLHTGGMCHLDATMTRQGLEALGTDELDIVILENVGNLVCPAEFDTGAAKNAMILSVPEGDDKPLKYPLMFSVCHALLVNKIDTLPVFDFDLAAVEQRARQRNPQLEMFPVSARTGEGMAAWVSSFWSSKGLNIKSPPLQRVRPFYKRPRYRACIRHCRRSGYTLWGWLCPCPCSPSLPSGNLGRRSSRWQSACTAT